MKLIFNYTLDYIKRNRRGSIAIMVAILMVATMLSALCGYLYNVYSDNLSLILRQSGNWHGELFAHNTFERELTTAESFESVEATLIKGPWMVAQIDDPRRAYLIWRDADAEYWRSMPEGNMAILAGRTPAAAGEIALSKQYFESHPELRLGDSITLPTGNRTAPNSSVIDPVDTATAGEYFVQTGETTLTVVGKLDVATSSTVPCYTALGFLDRATLAPSDEVTIYLRFKDIRNTYVELPKIAQALGWQQDEYGSYNLRYNSAYLIRLLVFSPQQLAKLNLLEVGAMPLSFVVIGLLAAGVFVLVIHNAFALSANTRLVQLGILSSIGATPRQIKRSVLLEALLLSAVPLPVGLVLGQLAVKLMLVWLNTRLALVETAYDSTVTFTIGWLSVLPAILLSLLTVLWSALIPARRVARLSPIDAIRQGESLKLKKPRKHSLMRLLGLEGELAGNAIRARKRSYRTATASLVLSFLILTSFLCINSASTAATAVYAYLEEYKWSEKNVEIALNNISSPQDYAVTQEIEALPEVKSALWYNQLFAAIWLPPQQLSPAFRTAGGYEEAGNALGMRIPLLRDGKYRVTTILVGLDDVSFAAYCNQLGLDPAPFYEADSLRTILYNSIEDVITSSRRNPVLLPYLAVQPGDTLAYTEKLYDDSERDGSFTLQVAATTSEFPPMGQRVLGGRYDIVQFLPMSRLNALGAELGNLRTNRINGAVLAQSPTQITPARIAIDRICNSWFGSGDYSLWDYDDMMQNKANGNTIVAIMFGFVAGLFAVIGLSNAWATVRGTLTARRREFAMLRSVGLAPRGLKKMLLLEALLLGLTPILASLPFVVALQVVFLSINEITFMEWLPFAPWLPVLLYTVAVLAVTCAAYLTGGRLLLRENIVEAVKQDML